LQPMPTKRSPFCPSGYPPRFYRYRYARLHGWAEIGRCGKRQVASGSHHNHHRQGAAAGNPGERAFYSQALCRQECCRGDENVRKYELEPEASGSSLPSGSRGCLPNSMDASQSHQTSQRAQHSNLMYQWRLTDTLSAICTILCANLQFLTISCAIVRCWASTLRGRNNAESTQLWLSPRIKSCDQYGRIILVSGVISKKLQQRTASFWCGSASELRGAACGAKRSCRIWRTYEWRQQSVSTSYGPRPIFCASAGSQALSAAKMET
jgi:hypothetical protein